MKFIFICVIIFYKIISSINLCSLYIYLQFFKYPQIIKKNSIDGKNNLKNSDKSATKFPLLICNGSTMEYPLLIYIISNRISATDNVTAWPNMLYIVRFGPPSPPMSRASTQVPLTVLFLVATHGPKTRTPC
jgi:hypothetical protein